MRIGYVFLPLEIAVRFRRHSFGSVFSGGLKNSPVYLPYLPLFDI
jgi:hypothetical protein